MSRIALIDKAGDLHSLAHRLDREGHAARYWIKGRPEDPDLVKIGHGIVNRVDTMEAAVAGADAVIAYGLPKEADALVASGVPCWGASAFAKKLEDDRAFAHELAEQAGIAVPEFHEFAKVEEAVAFATQHADQAWVFKAEGNVAATTTHVCKTPEELAQVLESEGKNPEVKKFILEAFIEGVEISTEGWFDYRIPGGWLTPFNSTLERKRFGAGDVGPNVGCMGSVVWTWPVKSPQLVAAVLRPMTPALMEARYVGPFDHNAILKDGTPYVLEPTPRIGWDAFEALATMIPEGALGDFLVALAQGKATRVPVADTFGAAVRIFMPIKPDAVRKHVPYPALDVPEGPGFWFKDVFRDGKTLRSTQTEPNFGFTIVAEVSGAGDSLEAALAPIYGDRIPMLTIDGMYFRKDIGEQAKQDLAQLKAWGYEVPGTWENRVQPAAPPRTLLSGRGRS